MISNYLPFKLRPSSSILSFANAIHKDISLGKYIFVRLCEIFKLNCYILPIIHNSWIGLLDYGLVDSLAQRELKSIVTTAQKFPIIIKHKLYKNTF